MRHLKAKILIYLGLGLLLCASAMAQNSKSDNNLKGKYQTIEVTRFEVAEDVEIASNHIEALMLEIIDELYKRKVFKKIIKPTAKDKTETESNDEPKLRIIGTITNHSIGIPAEKYTIGFGNIWAKMRVQIKVIDASDGKILLEKGFVGKTYFPSASDDSASRIIAENITKRIKKMFF